VQLHSPFSNRYGIVVMPVKSLGGLTFSARGSIRIARARPRRPMNRPSSNITLSHALGDTAPRLSVKSSECAIAMAKSELST
jgi:hypothetical protein